MRSYFESFSVGGLVAGAAIVAGLLLVAIVLVIKPDRLSTRVLPHVATRSGLISRRNPLKDMIGEAWRRSIEAVGSTRSSVERRLGVLGNESVADFRLQQLQWAAIGGAVGIIVGFALIMRGGSVLLALVAVAFGIIGGAMACDANLSRRAEQHSNRITAELPDAVELIALAVGSGESIRAALERVTALGSGALHDEFSRTLGDVRSGSPLSAALTRMGERSGNASLARFADAVVSALEQGSGLTHTLYEQASDSRDAARRTLLEKGGQAEIRMMVPVIFFILPITVVFTLFPGLAALDFM